MDGTPRIKTGLDTNLLLGLFFDEDPNLALATEKVLQNPRLEICLPTLVGVELIATPRMRLDVQRPPIINEKIAMAQLFLLGCGATWFDLDFISMTLAQELATNYLLKPADAAILACCIEAGCKYLLTNDSQLIKNTASLSAIEVRSPLGVEQI